MSATPGSASRAANALPPLLLGAAWVLLCIAVDPRGDFPLNDDWSCGRAVRNLIEHGTYRLTGFTSMPLLTRVPWGALFGLPFGFSFTGLRVSTRALGLVRVRAIHGLLRRTTVPWTAGSPPTAERRRKPARGSRRVPLEKKTGWAAGPWEAPGRTRIHAGRAGVAGTVGRS